MQAEIKWRMQDQTIMPKHIISKDINYYIYFVINNIKIIGSDVTTLFSS